MHQTYRRSLVALACALTVSVASARQGTTAEGVMGEALHAEEVTGDLEKAIAGYEHVIADATAGRPLVARALLHLGRCEEWLGQSRATAAYERIDREFADQTDVVAEARSRLVALHARGDGVVARQVWAGEFVDPYGLPSTDGRLYAFVDWSSGTHGNLAIRDLSTGETRMLTSGLDAFVTAISPDGRQIAYVEDGPEMSIRVTDITGAHTRTLVQQPGLGAFGLRWSPDGRQLAALISQPPDDTWKIALVSVGSGRMTVLKNLGWQGGELAGFSPDGRRLLYAISETPSPGDTGIYVIAVDGSGETRIVHGPAKDASPSWTPDGTGVVFVSNRSGTYDLWLARVIDGRPRGEPELLRKSVGDINAMGFRSDGLFYYGIRDRQVDAYVCQIEPDTLRVVGPPVRVTDRFVGTNSGASWSPDGRRIAFFRGDDRRRMSLVVRTVSDGTERTIPVQLTDSISAGRMGGTWTPDSRALIVPDPDYAGGIWRFRSIDVETGASIVLLESHGTWGQARLSPDGADLFYTAVENPLRPVVHVLRLVRRTLATGQETELYRAESTAVGFFSLAVSPDGREIAFMSNEDGGRKLLALPVAGGPPRLLYRGTDTQPAPFGATWTPDGRYILATGERSGWHQGIAIFAYPAAGGDPRELDVTMPEILAPSLSPDGRQLAFSGAKSHGELWTIRNLLPSQGGDRTGSR